MITARESAIIFGKREYMFNTVNQNIKFARSSRRMAYANWQGLIERS